MSIQTETTRIDAVVRAFVTQLQSVEDGATGVRLLTRLQNASGAQLDGIGQILGVDRANRTDADYKTALYFQMFLNGSAGEPETLLAALRFMTQADHTRLYELFPGVVQLETDRIVDGLQALMQGLAPAGVRIDPIIHTPTGDPFIMAETSYIPPDTEGLGFGDTTDPLVGGRFNEII